MTDDQPDGLCDRCAQPTPNDELQPGPVGSLWTDAELCNDCFAEVV